MPRGLNLAVTLGIAIVGAALVAAGVPHAVEPRPAAGTSGTVEVCTIAGDFEYDTFLPSSVVVWEGDSVRVRRVNTEPEAHGFHWEAFDVHVDSTPTAGSWRTSGIRPTRAGTFLHVRLIHAREMHGCLIVLE